MARNPACSVYPPLDLATSPSASAAPRRSSSSIDVSSASDLLAIRHTMPPRPQPSAANDDGNPPLRSSSACAGISGELHRPTPGPWPPAASAGSPSPNGNALHRSSMGLRPPTVSATLSALVHSVIPNPRSATPQSLSSAGEGSSTELMISPLSAVGASTSVGHPARRLSRRDRARRGRWDGGSGCTAFVPGGFVVPGEGGSFTDLVPRADGGWIEVLLGQSASDVGGTVRGGVPVCIPGTTIH